MDPDKKNDSWEQQEGFVQAGLYAVVVMLGALMTQVIASAACFCVYLIVLSSTGRAGLSHPSREALIRIFSDMVNEQGMFIYLSYALAVAAWSGMLYFTMPERKNASFHIRAVTKDRRFPALIALGFGADITFSIAVSVVAYVFPEAFERYRKLMESLSLDIDIWTVLYVAVLGPIAEELLFRGVILDRLGRAYPFWMANLLQAVLFGIFHLNLIQGIYAFCFGLILGLVIRVTGSVCASMVVHMVFNGTSELLSVFEAQAVEDPAPWLLLYIAAIFCFIVGFRYIWREYGQQQA